MKIRIDKDIPEPSKGFIRKFGRALGDFQMINEGDTIMAGLSGGKDSIIMLLSLIEIRKRIKADFELKACTVDITGGDNDLDKMDELCKKLGIDYFVENHQVLEIIRKRNERSPCSLCSNMRRGILCNSAKARGCNVLALGHNLDDVAETALLNLFRTGRFKCFKPVTWLSRTQIRVIRPLIYIEESHIESEIERMALPVIKNKCPYDSNTKRQTMKHDIEKLKDSVPDIKLNIQKALTRYDIDDLWDIPEKDRNNN